MLNTWEVVLFAEPGDGELVFERLTSTEATELLNALEASGWRGMMRPELDPPRHPGMSSRLIP